MYNKLKKYLLQSSHKIWEISPSRSSPFEMTGAKSHVNAALKKLSYLIEGKLQSHPSSRNHISLSFGVPPPPTQLPIDDPDEPEASAPLHPEEFDEVELPKTLPFEPDELLELLLEDSALLIHI